MEINNSIKKTNNEDLENIQNKNIEKNKVKKIFKSASLTFYDNTNGYLLCEEYRFNEKKTLIHPVGGKTESYDKNLLETAIREFIEESVLESHDFINNSSNTKEELIIKINNIIKKNITYKDLNINKELNYYHRYYFVNMEKNLSKEFIDAIYDLPKFFNNNYKSEINLLVWINSENINDYKNKFSWLCKMFFKKFNIVL